MLIARQPLVLVAVADLKSHFLNLAFSKKNGHAVFLSLRNCFISIILSRVDCVCVLVKCV